MRLKDAIANDIATLLNVDEFADMRTINNKAMRAVVDQNLNKERFDKTNSNYVDGVFLDVVVVYVAASDFGPKPIVGEILKVDTDHYFVTHCAEVGGIFEITAEGNKS